MIDVNKIRLRRGVSADDDFLLRLYFDTQKPAWAQAGLSLNELTLILNQQFTIRNQSYRQSWPDAELQIVEYEGNPVGNIHLHRGGTEHRIIDIALLPEYQNRSIGKHLIQTIQNSAANASVFVSLQVQSDNLAIKLYQRLGFEAIDDTGTHLQMRWHPDTLDQN